MWRSGARATWLPLVLAWQVTHTAPVGGGPWTSWQFVQRAVLRRAPREDELGLVLVAGMQPLRSAFQVCGQVAARAALVLDRRRATRRPASPAAFFSWHLLAALERRLAGRVGLVAPLAVAVPLGAASSRRRRRGRAGTGGSARRRAAPPGPRACCRAGCGRACSRRRRGWPGRRRPSARARAAFAVDGGGLSRVAARAGHRRRLLREPRAHGERVAREAGLGAGRAVLWRRWSSWHSRQSFSVGAVASCALSPWHERQSTLLHAAVRAVPLGRLDRAATRPASSRGTRCTRRPWPCRASVDSCRPSSFFQRRLSAVPDGVTWQLWQATSSCPRVCQAPAPSLGAWQDPRRRSAGSLRT